jgi:hypothetical protein
MLKSLLAPLLAPLRLFQRSQRSADERRASEARRAARALELARNGLKLPL